MSVRSKGGHQRYIDACTVHAADDSYRFVEPSKAYVDEYDLPDVSKWVLGKDGPLKVTYPATVGKGQKDVRDVSGVPHYSNQARLWRSRLCSIQASRSHQIRCVFR